MAEPDPQQQQRQQQEDVHGEPYDGMECLCTMNDISLEDGNYVEYQSYPSLKWKPCLYEKDVVVKLLAEQFPNFVQKVKTTDCQAELRRLLATGPPVWLEDKHALPLEEPDTHVQQLWWAASNETVSAQLEGALTGEARQALWDELKEFLIEGGGDEEDDEKEEKDDTNNPNK